MTATRETLLALAERVKALTGPCRETDKAILLALGYSWRGMAYWHHDDRRKWDGPTFFTASLDAAMTLVPNPAWVRMDEWPHDFCAPVASVQPVREPKVGAASSTGTTLALALTAACLRAQAERTPA